MVATKVLEAEQSQLRCEQSRGSTSILLEESAFLGGLLSPRVPAQRATRG